MKPGTPSRLQKRSGRSAHPRVTTPLTPFEVEYIKLHIMDGLSPTAAARIVKPNIKNHDQWIISTIRKPAVQAAIADARAAVALTTGMTKKKVIDGFMEAIDMARTKADPLVMVSGWREIGKMCGFYEPTRAELTITLEGKKALDKLQTMSDQQLLALTQEQTAAIDAEFREVMSGAPAE